MTDRTGDKMVIGECKFRNEQFDKAEFETMLSRRTIFPFAKETAFFAFSKSGFSVWGHENAGICLSTTLGLDVLQWKRSRTCDWYVHIVHMVSDPGSYRMFALDFYDAVLVSGLIPNHTRQKKT